MLSFTVQSVSLTSVMEGGSIAPQQFGSRFPWTMFDLALPIAPQLRVLRPALESAQKELGITPRPIKLHRTLWPLYLRLLDADLDSRTPKQIADLLQYEIEKGVSEGKVWDQLRAAKRMIQPGGYLSIFLSTEKSAP